LPFLYSSIRYDDAGSSAHRTYLRPVPATAIRPWQTRADPRHLLLRTLWFYRSGTGLLRRSARPVYGHADGCFYQLYEFYRLTVLFAYGGKRFRRIRRDLRSN
jgi:hypothetical protein